MSSSCGSRGAARDCRPSRVWSQSRLFCAQAGNRVRGESHMSSSRSWTSCANMAHRCGFGTCFGPCSQGPKVCSIQRAADAEAQSQLGFEMYEGFSDPALLRQPQAGCVKMTNQPAYAVQASAPTPLSAPGLEEELNMDACRCPMWTSWWAAAMVPAPFCPKTRRRWTWRWQSQRPQAAAGDGLRQLQPALAARQAATTAVQATLNAAVALAAPAPAAAPATAVLVAEAAVHPVIEVALAESWGMTTAWTPASGGGSRQARVSGTPVCRCRCSPTTAMR